MSYDKEYFEELDFKLREEIKKNIRKKEGIEEIDLIPVGDRSDISDNPINFESGYIDTDYKPVFKCEYTKKDGQKVSFYIKPNISKFLDYSTEYEVNEDTVFSLSEMGTMGYTIPEFTYSQNIIIDMGDGEEVNFNILTTENVKEIIDEKYLDSNKEIVEISEIETINRLLLHEFEISDNKTINVEVFKKLNDKYKTVYFDPNNFRENSFVMCNHFIEVGIYKSFENFNKQDYTEDKEKDLIKINKNIEQIKQGNVKDVEFYFLKKYNEGTFEYYATKIFVDFVKEQIESNHSNSDIEKNIEILNDFESLTLNEFYRIAGKYKIIDTNNKIIINSKNFYNFLLEKRKQLMKEKIDTYFSKINYYHNKNKEILNKFKNFEGDKKYISETAKKNDEKMSKYVKFDTENYQPVILSNIVGKTYGNMSLLNFKQPKGILDLKEKENGDFKVKQLYKENKNRKLEDMSILISKSKTKIKDIESKEGREEIQNMILESLIELANDNNISLAELSCIILKSINEDKEHLNENEKDISKKFKENMENRGIYSTKKAYDKDSKIIVFEENGGLGFEDLPKSIIELLIDRKKEFKTKFKKNKERLEENLKRRDKIILERTIDDFDKKVIVNNNSKSI